MGLKREISRSVRNVPSRWRRTRPASRNRLLRAHEGEYSKSVQQGFLQFLEMQRVPARSSISTRAPPLRTSRVVRGARCRLSADLEAGAARLARAVPGSGPGFEGRRTRARRCARVRGAGRASAASGSGAARSARRSGTVGESRFTSADTLLGGATQQRHKRVTNPSLRL